MGGGGKGKSKAPPTPDYTGLARETGEQNRLAARELTAANRPNQYDFRGNSLTWSQDPTSGQWSQQVSLAPDTRAGQDMYDYNTTRRSTQAGWNVDALTNEMMQQNRSGVDPTWYNNAKYESPLADSLYSNYNNAQPLDSSIYSNAKYENPIDEKTFSNYDNAKALDPNLFSNAKYEAPIDEKLFSNANISGDKVADALYNSVMTRGRKEQARESDALNTQLRNTGLVPGSEAYNRAMQNLLTSQNDANLLASQNATLAGAGEARAQRTANLADRQGMQTERLQNRTANIADRGAMQNERLQNRTANIADRGALQNERLQNIQANLANRQQMQGERLQNRTANIADRGALQNERLQNIQANLANRQQLQGEQLGNRAARLQEIAANQSQIQAPYSPTFQGFSGATGYNPTDLLGAANAQFGAGMAKTNASNSKKGGLLGAGASLGGSYLGSK